jgi:hypothetical protein
MKATHGTPTGTDKSEKEDLRIRRPDGVVLVALWAFFNTFLGVCGIVGISVFAFPSVIEDTHSGLAGALAGLSFGTLLLAASVVATAASGIGLMMGKEWGRILGIVHAALQLIWIPVGTILGVLAMLYLMRPQVRKYFQPTTGH